MRRVLPSVTFLLALSAGSLLGQAEASFTFFHGQAGDSRAVVDDQNRALLGKDRTFSRFYAVGTQVCIDIKNAHPVNYKYSLDVVVDTAQPELPDLSQFITLLSGLKSKIPVAAAASDSADTFWANPATASPGTRANSGMPEALTALIAALAQLKIDLDTADLAVRASDTPEPLNGSAPGKTGFGYAQTVLAALPSTPFRFNDAKLKERLDKQYESAKTAVAKNPVLELVVEALGGHADLMIARRDKLRSSYSRSLEGPPRPCKGVVTGRNTFRLAVARLIESGTRDVTGADGKGIQLLTIEVQSRFPRKIVSIDPLSLGVLSWNVPQFKIEADTLAAPLENSTIARPGLMLSLNPASWGVVDDWGLGLGLGMGLGTDDIVTDILMGVTISYRNTLRAGVGYGRSRQPVRVRNVKVGQKLPADFGKLNDAIETGSFAKDAVYFIVALPGLSLKSK